MNGEKYFTGYQALADEEIVSCVSPDDPICTTDNCGKEVRAILREGFLQLEPELYVVGEVEIRANPASTAS